MNDLISREAVQRIMNERLALLKNNTQDQYSTGRFCGYSEASEAVDDVPAIDAEPVRHGYWIQVFVSSGRNSWQCSECGRRARGKLKNLPYCHCGARMDLEVQHD